MIWISLSSNFLIKLNVSRSQYAQNKEKIKNYTISILIVDDNVFNLLILEKFISSNKFYTFQIIKATNGLEAIKIFKERNF